MKRGCKNLQGVIQRYIKIVFNALSDNRHPDAEEPVPFPVFALSGLEEPLGVGCYFIITKLLELVYKLVPWNGIGFITVRISMKR